MATRVTSTRFVGRDAELAELRAALADAAGGRPSLAFVAGESGVGKTRLLSELERAAESSGARVLVGECVDLGEGELAYAPLVAALRPLARDGDPALEALPAASRDALLPGLTGTAPPREAADEAAQARARLFEALLDLLDRLSAESGLLLAIEDLHWADRSTRAFLTYLASSLCHERVLVVATYRPDELHRRHPLRPLLAELERDSRARRVELEPFTKDELAEQLSDILGTAPDADLLARLWTRSEGNPLYAEELLAAGLDGRGTLPPTMREALLLRIDQLDRSTQDVVRLLAVAQRLDHGVLAAAAELDRSALRDALRDAVAAQIVVVDGEDRYAFRHALLREVVSDDLLPGERAELHLTLARALEAHVEGAHAAAAVAHHYSAAGDQPAALAASVRAGQELSRLRAYGEAAALYERALELWDRVPDAEERTELTHVDLLRAAAMCHATVHEVARAETLLRAAVDEVDEEAEPLLAATVLERLARQQFRGGKPRDAEDTRARALALLPDEPTAERAMLLASAANERMLASRYREAVDIAHEAIEQARATGTELAEIRALDALGVSKSSLGDHEEGFNALRCSIESAREAGMLMTMFTTYVNLADALSLSGRLQEGREVAAEVLGLAREAGHTSRWLDLLSSELSFLAGDWAASESCLPEQGRRSMGNTFLNEAGRRVDLALGRGEHDRARELLDEVAPLIETSREPQFIGPYAAQLAELERRAGDLDAARNAVEEGLDRIEFCSEDAARISLVSTMGLRVEADAALRARDLGDAEAERVARQVAELLLARVEATAGEGRPVEHANLLTARADASRAAGEEDAELWAAAAEAWDVLERPYPAALARAREAEARLAAADRDGASATTLTALTAAREIGATWLTSELEGFASRARLKLGEEAEPATADDPFGLTPRERQVLELLAGGRTNREIGQSLYMAEKTASVHVSRILSKLDVRTRTEAAAVAHRLGLA